MPRRQLAAGLHSEADRWTRGVGSRLHSLPSSSLLRPALPSQHWDPGSAWTHPRSPTWRDPAAASRQTCPTHSPTNGKLRNQGHGSSSSSQHLLCSPFFCKLLQTGQCLAKVLSPKLKAAEERLGVGHEGHAEAPESEVPALADHFLHPGGDHRLGPQHRAQHVHARTHTHPHSSAAAPRCGCVPTEQNGARIWGFKGYFK